MTRVAVWIALAFGAWGAGARAGPVEEGRPVFGLFSQDGESALEFHLSLQFLWDYNYFERTTEGDWATDNRILFRRIRPVMRGFLLERRLSFLLHLSVVPGSAELMDLSIGYRFHRQAHVRVGVGKIPFTRHRLNSFTDRTVVDWSYPTWYFGAERQWGVTVHNGIASPPPLEYQVGVYTGVNTRAANGVGMARTFAEEIVSSSRLDAPRPFQEMHTELVAHVAYTIGAMVLKRPTDLEGGPPRFSVGLSAAWDLDPIPREDMRLRLAPEVEFRVRGLSLGCVFYLGLWDQVTGERASYQPGFVGGLLRASYVFAERYELALRYTTVHVLEALRKDARAYADERIAAAQDPAEIVALSNRFQDVGRTETEHAIELGFNWFVYGTLLKWQVDVGLLMHDRTDGTLRELRLRTQLQLAF